MGDSDLVPYGVDPSRRNIVRQQHLDHGPVFPVDDIGMVRVGGVAIRPKRADELIASVVVVSP